MTIDIKLAGYQPNGSLLSQTLRLFSDFLKENLSGGVNIGLVNNIMDLGHSPGNMPALVASGKFDLGYIATSYFARDVPELYIFDLPFAIRNRIQAYRLLDGPFSEIISSDVEQKINLRALAIWEYGYRHFTNDSHPIRTPFDCQGLPIRTLLNELHPIMFKALGFKPKTLQVNELLSYLKAGKKLAQENALTNYYNFGLYKYHRHITISGHLLGMAVFICNQEVFKRWPKKVQEFVMAAAHDATLKQRKLAEIEEESILKKLSPDTHQIHTLNEEELQLFEVALTSTTQPYRDKIGKAVLKFLFD